MSRTAETFESLIEASKDSLDQLMTVGSVPAIDDLLGWEFRGWNIQAATAILGTRKFKKGFFGEAGAAEASGYNVPVVQNGKKEPWIAKPSEEKPKRYFFFKALPASAVPDAKYPKSVVVDYRRWEGYFALNPVRFTVDYLVCPEPTNRHLVLGKSYWQAGPLSPFLGYFVLERHNAAKDER